jgi:hypothetical protein
MITSSRPRSAWRWIGPIAFSAAFVATPAITTASPETMPAPTVHPTSVRPAQSTNKARLELVDQRLAVDPNGTIELRYLLTGLSGDPLQLLAPPEPLEPAEPPVTDPADPAGATPEPPPEPPEPPPTPPALVLEVTNYAPLTDPDDVARVVGSDVDPDTFRSISNAIDGVVIDARPLLRPNDDGTASLVLDIDTDVVDSIETRLKLDQPGIYPLRLQLLLVDDGNEDLIATAGTVIQRVAGAVDADVDVAPAIDLAVVTATPAPPPDADDALLERSRAQLDAAIELASAVDAPVTLEVPPTLIADEAATPAGAERLADALADDELVALPIVPLDVSSAVAAGQADSYTRLLGAGEDLLTAAVPTTPSRRDIWLTTVPLSAGGAQLLRDLGTRFIVIPADLYAETIDDDLPPSDLFVEAALPDGGTLPFLVVGPLAEELTPQAADRILARSTTTEWAVSTLGELLVEQADDDAATSSAVDQPTSPPRRSRVLSTPDLKSPDARLIGALEELATTTPAVRFSPASALVGLTDVLIDDDAPVMIQLPDVAGPPLEARVELIALTRLQLASAASMLPDDDPRITAWSATLDTLISTGYTDAEARAIAAEMITEAESLTDAVELPQPFTFTLTGRRGTIEIRIGNTRDEPLDVVVSLDSEKVTFPEGDQQVTLRPLDETSLFVPVQAESNGTSPINLVVSTPAGQPLEDPVTLTARVSALTGLGQVLTGGLILVLLTWWFTHWRSRRRAELAIDVRDRHPSTGTVESDKL